LRVSRSRAWSSCASVLNFENKAGKLSPEDYASLSASLEDEAAVLLAEIDELQHAEWNEAASPSR
jgi:hypothetical protein